MIGTSIAHYEITAKLGEGGMGAVYRARDTKLDREVALKVLPPQVSGDPERLARFRREAKVLASLNHPNIAGIHGLEEAQGRSFLVMELAEGEDLAARLKRGAVPTAEAIEIAAQIARGLEEAHEKGIVHRDLKPANVMVSAEGKVKLLDFGLARAYAGDSVDEGDLEHSPTITAAMTQAGVILGTAAYMSPEQAKGRPVDRRADIWSFGVVLFEMLTGASLFAAETISESVAAVLMRPIDLSLLPDGLPASVRALLERCLERDPHNRLRDIGEARILLRDVDASSVLTSSISSSAAFTAPHRPRAARLPWVLVAILAAALMLSLWRASFAPKNPVPGPTFSSLESPDGAGFHLAGTNPAPAMFSPDGTRIVFGARGPGATPELWIRDLSSPLARKLPGTEGAKYHFWSPRGDAVAFFSDGSLRVLDLASRTVREIAAVGDGKGGCWLPDDVILLTPSSDQAISRLDLATGTLTEITDLNADPPSNSHRLPRPLGTNGFLFAARLEQPGSGPPVAIMAASLDGSVVRELVRAVGQAEYANGHLLYLNDSALIARPLDPDTLEFTGPPHTLGNDVGLIPGAALALFSTSTSGQLVYHPGHHATLSTQLIAIDRNGNRAGPLGSLDGVGSFDVSPDGRRLAAELWGDRSGLADLWVYDLDTDVTTRLTFESVSEQAPRWSADGETIYYARHDGTETAVMRLMPDSRAEPELVRRWPEMNLFWDVSPDETLILASARDSTIDNNRLYLAPADGSTEPVLVDADVEQTLAGTFSPDGRWIAYALLEDGGWNIYLKTNPPTGRKWQLVDELAFWYAWDRSSERIYFQWSASELYVVDVDLTGATPRIGSPRVVLEEFPSPVTQLHNLGVSPDGQRFYVTDAGGADDARPLRLVQNWTRFGASDRPNP